MNSCIYLGDIYHSRIRPRKNSFRYRSYVFYLDLDELDSLDKLKLLSVNRWNLFSFFDRDHFRFIDMSPSKRDEIMQEKVRLDRDKYKNLNTKERVVRMCRDEGFDFEIGKVFLITNLRLLGHLFNPASFYFVYDRSGKFRIMISEVHNTFHDQKMFYTTIGETEKGIHEAKQEKNFYISPFTDLDNILKWRFKEPGKELLMQIDSMRKGEVELATILQGKKKELNNRNLAGLFFRFPLYTIMIVVRIHWQALKLFIKKVPFNRKDSSDDYLLKKIRRKKI